MSTRPVPEVWGRVMMEHGYSHRGIPSISALARKADISVETARRFIHKAGVPEAATVAALSDLLGDAFVSEWMGTPTAGAVYEGPDVSRYLNERQRLAVTELINAFVKDAPEITHGPITLDSGTADLEIPTEPPSPKRTRRSPRDSSQDQ